jgi:hypothetical protein
MVQGSNLRTTRAAAPGFRPGSFPLGQPSLSGEWSNRSPHRHGCALVSSEARPLAGSLSIEGRSGIEPLYRQFCRLPPTTSWSRPVPSRGFEPRTPGVWTRRLCQLA